MGARPAGVGREIIIEGWKMTIHLNLPKCWKYFLRQEPELGHDVIVRHPCEIEATDEVVHAKRIHEALDASDTVFWIPYNEAILTERLQGNCCLIL